MGGKENMNSSALYRREQKEQKAMFKREVKECMRELRKKHPYSILIEHSFIDGLIIWPRHRSVGERVPVVKMNHKVRFYDPCIVEKYLKREGYRHIRTGDVIRKYEFYLK